MGRPCRSSVGWVAHVPACEPRGRSAREPSERVAAVRDRREPRRDARRSATRTDDAGAPDGGPSLPGRGRVACVGLDLGVMAWSVDPPSFADGLHTQCVSTPSSARPPGALGRGASRAGRVKSSSCPSPRFCTRSTTSSAQALRRYDVAYPAVADGVEVHVQWSRGRRSRLDARSSATLAARATCVSGRFSGTGLDEVDVAGFLRRGIRLANTLGSSARSRSPSMRSSSSSCSRSGSKPPVRPLDDPGSGT